MKKKLVVTLMLFGIISVSLTGCGAKSITGSVSTDGSASMEKVIGVFAIETDLP